MDAHLLAHHISQKMRHGEAAGVDRMQLEPDLADLRSFLTSFPLDDIYNLDETGLFWKALPDRTLASENIPGGKLAKERLTAVFCCNASGSHKLDPWFIHKYAKPRCFKGINIHTLAMEWRANSKAWMTGNMFREYLIWLNQQVAGRKVALLLDGLSAHRTGIEFLTEEGIELKNLEIRFLPENTTSLCQPLDQGIIRTWKAYYKQRWLRFAIQHFEKEEDPAQHMTVLQAVRWALAAWQEDVSQTTIQNCWLKARVLAPKFGPCTRVEAEKGGWKEDQVQEDVQYNATLKQIESAIHTLARSLLP